MVAGSLGYLTAGVDDLIDDVNTTCLDWLGLSRVEVVGRRSIQDLLAPGDRIYYDTHIRPLLEITGEVKEIAVELVDADGGRRPVLINVAVHADATGGRTRTVVVLIEATERRRYEQELLRQRQVAERAAVRVGALYEVASGLAGILTEADVARVVSERSAASFDGAECSVWLFDSDLGAVTRAGSDETATTVEIADVVERAPALAQLANGEVLVVEDSHASIGEYPLIEQWMRSAGRRSLAIAPLHADGRLIGLLGYGFDVVHEFDEQDRQVALTLATQTNHALERARGFGAEVQSRERLEGLLRFSTRLSGAMSVDEVLDTIDEEGGRLLRTRRIRVVLLDEEHRTVRYFGGGQPSQDVALATQSVGCEVVRTGEVVFCTNGRELRRRFPESPLLAEGHAGRVIGVPLARDGEVSGAVVVAFSSPGAIIDADRTLVRVFAEQADQAVRRAVLHDNEVSARRRADQLLALSSAVNAAVTTREVAGAITSRGMRAFDAAWLAVYVAEGDDNERDRFELFAHGDAGDATPDFPVEISAHEGVVADLAGRRTPRYAYGRPTPDLDCGAFLELPWSALGFLPLTMSDRLVGLVAIGFEDTTDLTPAAQVALAGLTAEASAALGRARRYELQHEVAVTLQASLLAGELPTTPGWRISVVYRPGSEHLMVGGDLFDVTVAGDGRTVVIVGDVVGHGLDAAASMGQLRSAARALALVSDGPLEVLQGLDKFARITPGVRCSSLVCLSLTPDGAGTHASAGHPYPVLCHPDGRSELLLGGRSALLGVGRNPDSEATFEVEPGGRVVVYTDGLVERPGEHPDDGFARLRGHLEAEFGPGQSCDASAIARTVLGRTQPRDDAVVVCVARI